MKSDLHQKLQDKAIKYLLDKGYWIVRQEMQTPVGICDVWGIEHQHHFPAMAIEVKVSRQDFHSSSQKYKNGNAHHIANENYILCPIGLIQPEEVHEDWGLLWYDGLEHEIFENKDKLFRIVNKKKAKFIEITDRQKLEILIHFLYNGVNKNKI